jgi:hypothetical protein
MSWRLLNDIPYGHTLPELRMYLPTLLYRALMTAPFLSFHGYSEPLDRSLKTTRTLFHAPASLTFSLLSVSITTSTTLLNPSISSSTVPPMPALAKLIELPTYTGLPVLRASSFDNRVVKSNVPPWVNSGVLSVSFGAALCALISQDSK